MANLRFFDQRHPSLDEIKRTHLKLKKAHELLKKNKSHRAKKAQELLHDNTLKTLSFFELNRKNYQKMIQECALHATHDEPRNDGNILLIHK